MYILIFLFTNIYKYIYLYIVCVHQWLYLCWSIHQPQSRDIGRLMRIRSAWSTCDAHRDVKTQPLVWQFKSSWTRTLWTIQLVMLTVTQPVFGGFHLWCLRWFLSVAACGTIQLMMLIAMLTRSRSWDNSIRDGINVAASGKIQLVMLIVMSARWTCLFEMAVLS